MYKQFIFKEGNPYVAKTDEEFFRMLCKYDVTQVESRTFQVNEERKHAKTYFDKKVILRGFALDWQLRFSDFCYSWGDISDYGEFFEVYGGKYGLLREFRENGIC